MKQNYYEVEFKNVEKHIHKINGPYMQTPGENIMNGNTDNLLEVGHIYHTYVAAD